MLRISTIVIALLSLALIIGYAYKDYTTPFIIGGVGVSDEEAKTTGVVRVRISEGNVNVWGSGSVINERWVLTVAHIFFDNEGNRRTGQTEVNYPTGESYAVSNIHIYPSFDPTDAGFPDHPDVALLEMQDPVEVWRADGTVWTNFSRDLYSGSKYSLRDKQVLALGYGLEDENDPSSFGHLNYAWGPIDEIDDDFLLIHEDNLEPGSASISEGDSGGPFIVSETGNVNFAAKHNWVIAGVEFGFFWGGLDAWPWDWADSDIYATSVSSIRNWVYRTMDPGYTPPPTSCSSQVDCSSVQWCIAGFCRPKGYTFDGSCRSTENCTSAMCVAARNEGTGIDILGRCEDGEAGMWDPDTLPPSAECMCLAY